MNGGSCSLYIEGKGKVSVSIGGSPSMPSISFTGLHGHGAVGYNIARVCEKAAIRCALRSAGFDIPRASIRIDVDVSAHEFGHMCIENACAQGTPSRAVRRRCRTAGASAPWKSKSTAQRLA